MVSYLLMLVRELARCFVRFVQVFYVAHKEMSGGPVGPAGEYYPYWFWLYLLTAKEHLLFL